MRVIGDVAAACVYLVNYSFCANSFYIIAIDKKNGYNIGYIMGIMPI